MPRRARRALHPVDDAGALADQVLALAVGPLGIFLLEARDRCHAAVVPFAAQPAEKSALQQLGVEPVGLRPSVLARHGNARRVDDIGLDAACPQPARQPEAVAARLVGNRDPSDRSAGLGRLVAPAMQQRQQRTSSAASFFSGWRSTPGTIAGDQPARLAHLNDRDQQGAVAESEPPPDWWTPLVSFARSGKVSNGSGTGSL